MFWFCAINNEISTSFLAKKLRGIINSDMLQGSSNTRSLFLCFFLYLTWLLGCYCKIIRIRTVTTGSDTVSLREPFPPTEPDTSAKLGVIPGSRTNIFLLGGMKERMNKRETAVCPEAEQRLRGPRYPRHGTARSAARLSLAQNPGTSLRETSAGSKRRLHQCVQKELVLRPKD